MGVTPRSKQVISRSTLQGFEGGTVAPAPPRKPARCGVGVRRLIGGVSLPQALREYNFYVGASFRDRTGGAPSPAKWERAGGEGLY